MDDRIEFAMNEIRAWRPKERSDFIGAKNHRQDDRWNLNAIARRLPCMLLLIAPQCCGNSERARYIKKVYCCSDRTADGTPCHKCEGCVRQGPQFNEDAPVCTQYEIDCYEYDSKAKLMPLLVRIRNVEKPAVFFDHLDALNGETLSLMLSFLDRFKGVFIAAVTDVAFREMQRQVPTTPAVSQLLDRLTLVYLYAPESEEIVTFLKAKAPEWGVTADEEMLRLLVTASGCSFRRCLDVLQAAHDNTPPVLDRATIEEFLTLLPKRPDESLELEDEDDAEE
jgi:hypothetical protein